jgi:hypothetical protein
MPNHQHDLTAKALVTEGPDIMQARMTLRMNYAVPHLVSAAMFSRRVGDIETAHLGQGIGPFWEEVLAHASACIFLAVAGLESYANELFADWEQNFPGKSNEEVKKRWKERDSIFAKLDNALIIRGKCALNRGEERYESARDLVKLRNALVHFKPEWDDKQVKHKMLSCQLRKHFKPSFFIPNDPGLFPRAWASHDCTVWALNAVVRFVGYFEDRAGLSHKLDQFATRLIP